MRLRRVRADTPHLASRPPSRANEYVRAPVRGAVAPGRPAAAARRPPAGGARGPCHPGESGHAPGQVVPHRDRLDLRRKIAASLLLVLADPEPSLHDERLAEADRLLDVPRQGPPRPHGEEARAPVGPAAPLGVPAAGRRGQPESDGRNAGGGYMRLRLGGHISHHGHQRLVHRRSSPFSVFPAFRCSRFSIRALVPNATRTSCGKSGSRSGVRRNLWTTDELWITRPPV